MRKNAQDYLFDSQDILEEIALGGTRQSATQLFLQTLYNFPGFLPDNDLGSPPFSTFSPVY